MSTGIEASFQPYGGRIESRENRVIARAAAVEGHSQSPLNAWRTSTSCFECSGIDETMTLIAAWSVLPRITDSSAPDASSEARSERQMEDIVACGSRGVHGTSLRATEFPSMAGGTTGSRRDAAHGWPTPSKSGPRSPAPVPQVHWALGSCLNGLFQGVENLDRPPYAHAALP